MSIYRIQFAALKKMAGIEFKQHCQRLRDPGLGRLAAIEMTMPATFKHDVHTVDEQNEMETPGDAP